VNKKLSYRRIAARRIVKQESPLPLTDTRDDAEAQRMLNIPYH